MEKAKACVRRARDLDPDLQELRSISSCPSIPGPVLYPLALSRVARSPFSYSLLAFLLASGEPLGQFDREARRQHFRGAQVDVILDPAELERHLVGVQ